MHNISADTVQDSLEEGMHCNLSHLSQQPSLKELQPKLKGKSGRPKSSTLYPSVGFMTRLDKLSKNLQPITFMPDQDFDLNVHEHTLRRLGLWDFAHVEFDTSVRSDVLVKLLAYYRKERRISYFDNCRVEVNKTRLARVLKLSCKASKKGGKRGLKYSSEFLVFMEKFVRKWILLCDDEDDQCLPEQAFDWIDMIRDGNFERVNWAKFVWCMVEQELDRGEDLEECYFASHLQLLIKDQFPGLLFDGGDVKSVEERNMKLFTRLADEWVEEDGNGSHVDMDVSSVVVLHPAPDMVVQGRNINVGYADVLEKVVIRGEQVIDDAGPVEMISGGELLDSDGDGEVFIDIEELLSTIGEPEENLLELSREQDSVGGMEFVGFAGSMEEKDGEKTVSGDTEIWEQSGQIVEQEEKFVEEAIVNNEAGMNQELLLCQIAEKDSEIQELKQKLDDLQRQKQAEVDYLKEELCRKNKEIEGYKKDTKKTENCDGISDKPAPLRLLEEYRNLLDDYDAKLEEIYARFVFSEKKS